MVPETLTESPPKKLSCRCGIISMSAKPADLGDARRNSPRPIRVSRKTGPMAPHFWLPTNRI